VTDEARRERRHIWIHRALLASLLAFTLVRLFILAGDGVFQKLDLLSSLTPVVWLGLAAAGGYADWPRRKAYRRLDERREQMLRQIHDRQMIVKAKSVAGSTIRLAARSTEDDFIAAKLERLDVNRILGDGRIDAATLDAVKAEGIRNARELRSRTNLTSISPGQRALLQRWCHEREAELSDEWRTLVTQAKTTGMDIQRLELEITSFEEEVDRLEQERLQLPPATGIAYLKRILGNR
jgi:hypothetical protein